MSLNFKAGFWRGLHDMIGITMHESRYDTEIKKNKYCDIMLYQFFRTAL